MLPTSNDSTKISYYRLGEFAKFVDFKQSADTLINTLKKENKSLYFSNQTKQLRIDLFKNITEPTYKSEIKSINERMSIKEKAFSVELTSIENQLSIANKKKWNWGAWGLIFGSAIGIVLGISI